MTRVSLTLWLVVLCALGGCQREPDRQIVEVFAAASLTDAFTALEAAFEAEHPRFDVRLTFAGSQVLRLQIERGAPADVFASANAAHVEALVKGGVARPGSAFATNGLVIITPAANPAGITTLRDLPRARRLVIGTPSVPVGDYTRRTLRRADAALGAGFAARVMARVVSEESNTRLVRAKVELGDADAAVVYATDARDSTRLHVVPIPTQLAPGVEYRAAPMVGAGPGAEVWMNFVVSPTGRALLVEHGFRAP